MARREVHIFSVSFLDVLSGALAAVLLLYVIVPKLDAEARRRLEEAEALARLEVEVEDVAAMIERLEGSVDAEVYEQLVEQMAALQGTVEGLREVVADFRQQIADLEDRLAERDAQVTALEGRVAELERQRDQAVEERARAAQDRDRAVQDRDQARRQRDQAQQQLAAARERLGFALQDKRIVVVVDVSGSMGPPTPDSPERENAIVQVIAGIKMLVATMDEAYEIDVVFYPDWPAPARADNPANSDFGALWGRLLPITDDRKYEVYGFLAGLSAGGPTPTGDVLEHVMATYPEAGTIVLLSDGLPSIGQGNNFRNMTAPEVEELLASITSGNAGAKTINTIGVGESFRQREAGNPAVRFLMELASRNGGFYVGF